MSNREMLLSMMRQINDGTDRQWRNEVQALRAFAILAVIGYHFWPGRLAGGFVGVDVFFVISGFLISSHILGQLRAGTFSIATFYARRIRRIFPAALLVLLFCLAGIVAFSSLLDWQNYSAQTAASALFGENWFLSALSVDYLGADASPSPVQHYWSLSVEEQFYLVWPLLLVLCALALRKVAHKKSPPMHTAFTANDVALFAVVAAISIASLAYSAVLVSTDPIPSFFNTFGRIWEFAFGTLLAIGLRQVSIPRAFRVILAVLGWVILVLTATLFSDAMPFPGPLALVPSVATLMVIAAGSFDQPRFAKRIYGNQPILFVAAVSFSAYLWHWPLLTFSTQLVGGRPPTWILACLVILTFVLAWLSTRFVENPIRFSRQIRNPGIVIVAGLSSALLVAFIAIIPWVAVERITATQSSAQSVSHGETNAMSVPLGSELPIRLCVGAEAVVDPEGCQDGPYPVIVPDLVANRELTFLQSQTPKCAAKPRDTENFSCVFGNPVSATKVALVGDSKAMKMFSALQVVATENDWSLTVFLRGACHWSKPDGSGTPCDAFRQEVSEQMTANRWDAVFLSSNPSGPRDVEAYRQLWKPLIDAATPVIVIRDNPNFEEDPRKCILAVKSGAELDSCAGDRQTVLGPDVEVDAAQSTPGIYLVDFSDIYCTASRCPVMIGGIYVYRDRTHINDEFARTLAPNLRDQLIEDLPELFAGRR